jgi:hypothetical protein
MQVIDAQIAVLRREAVSKAPNQFELIRALEFFKNVTGIKADAAYTPIGPIIGFDELLKARKRWVDWESGHTLMLDPRTRDVVAKCGEGDADIGPAVKVFSTIPGLKDPHALSEWNGESCLESVGVGRSVVLPTLGRSIPEASRHRAGTCRILANDDEH